MSKDDSKKSNVIPFPGVYEKLVNKALTSLTEEKFGETIKLCEQAMEIDTNDESVVFALVFALYEMDRVEDALEVFRNFTKNNIALNPEFHFFYIRILIELERLSDAREYIGMLTFRKIIPAEFIDQCNSLIHLVDILDVEHDSDYDEKFDDFDNADEYVNEVLKTGSYNELVGCVSFLGSSNVRGFLTPIKSFLMSDNDPLIKTFLLEILIEQQVDENITVTKLDETVNVNPLTCVLPMETEFFRVMQEVMSDMYEHTDPSKYQLSIHKLEFHNAILFPLPFNDEVEPWRLAYEMYIEVAFGASEFDYVATDETTNKLALIMAIESMLEY